MSNPKLKVENYQNFGGINSKFSPHLTSPMEFMDIRNFDFQTPGCLTQRWGSTQYMGQTLAGPITALSEFQKLNGTSYVITGSSGGLWYGATTGQFQGMSFTSIGGTLNNVGITAVQGVLEVGWKFLAGFGPTIMWRADPIYYQGVTSQGIFYGDATYYSAPQLQSGNYASIAYLVDYAFIADGTKFVKFDGITTRPISLPLPSTVSITMSFSLSLFTGASSPIGYGGTGAAVFYASYVNDRGFESPIVPIATCLGTRNAAGGSYIGPTTVGQTSIIAMTMTMRTPIEYGISSINIYSYCDQRPTVARYTVGVVPYEVYTSAPNFWSLPYTFLQNIPVSGSTITTFALGSSIGDSSNNNKIFNNNGPLPNPYVSQYQTLGLTLGPKTSTGTIFNGASDAWTTVDYYKDPAITNFYPRFLSVYDNRLFCAGFSSAPSTVWFSDVKEPEGFLPTNNFEVRTNDSDYITALKAYQTRLYIFKRNSFHVLGGDNPVNFFMQEVSNIYGCLNNRCAVLYENLLYFLDRKGVIEYTGANVSFASTKVQPIFDRMNYNAALTCACAAHDKLRNQLLFAIPIDGSTTNNITIVFDYIINAWTYYTGFNANLFAEIQGYNQNKRLFYGDYNGRVNWFSASFLSDNGTGFTASFKTRYLHDMGDSVQKQFRRLYVNADQLSATLSNNINFYQDYGTSIVLGTTLTLGAFQERIDYGISAKSIAYEFITMNNTNSVLKIHGFTIESRLQRKV